MSAIKRFLKGIKYKFVSFGLAINGNRLGKGTMVSNRATLRKTNIGNYSYVAEYTGLNCVDMGSYCSIGPSVHIGSMEHPYWKPSTSPRLYGEDCRSETRTTIGNDVWIGAQSCVRQGVKIGDGAVIGAQSFVNKDVPPYSIVFGTPAKVYKMRFNPSKIAMIRGTEYYKYPPRKAKELLTSITDILEKTEDL